MHYHPLNPSFAREYLAEALAAYEQAVARREKQASLRIRQRYLTEAWSACIEAGVALA